MFASFLSHSFLFFSSYFAAFFSTHLDIVQRFERKPMYVQIATDTDVFCPPSVYFQISLFTCNLDSRMWSKNTCIAPASKNDSSKLQNYIPWSRTDIFNEVCPSRKFLSEIRQIIIHVILCMSQGHQTGT